MAIENENITTDSGSQGDVRIADLHLALALQACRMAAWEWDPIRNVVTTSENIQDIYGMSSMDVAKQGFAMVHPDDRDRHRAMVERAVASGASYESEFRIVRPDTGAEVWIQEHGNPVLDERGRVVKLVGVVMDISEHKHAEEARRRSDERFRTIVTTANEGIWLVDLQARTDYANDRMAEMLGYTPQELDSLSVIDCTFPQDLGIHRERIGQNLQGKVEQFDTRFRRKDGSEVRVLGCTSPVRDADGSVIGALGMFTDVTTRVRAEQERLMCLAREQQARAKAEEAQQQLSLLAGAIAEGVVMVDRNARITFANAAARRISGVQPSRSLEEALNRFCVTTVSGDPYPVNQLPLVRALAHGETTVDARWRLRREDGSDIVLEGSAAPVMGENGEVLGAVSTFRDVTALLTLEQQKEDFLSAAAHDLKTPLTSIKGLAEVLERRMMRDTSVGQEQLREGLARIAYNAGRMTGLINELLDVFRLQMGEGLDLNLRVADLSALAAKCVAELQETLGIEVTFRCLLPELNGVWDSERLERVIGNLLSNAAKYSPQGTPIIVTVSREESAGRAWALLSVEDRGIGIPAVDLPHIFERFHRGRNVGRETTGTGIGLSGARQIVEQHGGTIDVASEEGVGSTFTVRLPIPGSP